jgi:hypothetical protein
MDSHVLGLGFSLGLETQILGLGFGLALKLSQSLVLALSVVTESSALVFALCLKSLFLNGICCWEA